jgi:hypothetical protein
MTGVPLDVLGHGEGLMALGAEAIALGDRNLE